MKRFVLLVTLTAISAVNVLGVEPGSIRRFPVGDEPWYLAVGDFNEDSHQDLVTADASSGTITVLFGTGFGGFPDTTMYFSGSFPQVLAVGEFNRDGHEDIVVCNSGPTMVQRDTQVIDDIAIFYGDGTGNFFNYINIDIGDYPAGVTIGDFNEDSMQDIAVANYRTHDVVILLGKTNGSFDIHQTIVTGGGPRSLIVGDFNEDSHQDLAVGLRTASLLTILEGDGSGSFTETETRYELYQFPRQVVVGDFNVDGHQDVAGACRGNSRIGVLHGRGDGTFSGPDYYDSGSYPRSMAVVDIDNDGRSDLATGNFDSNDVSFFMGNEDGTFIRWLDQPIGQSPRMLGEGDFDEDGYHDLAVVNAAGDEVAIMYGTPEFIKPRFVSPADSTWTNTNPTFVWEAAPGAKYFQLLLSDTLNTFSWSRIIHDDTSIAYDGNIPLSGGTPYTWTVRQNTGGRFWSFPDSWIFLRAGLQSAIGTPQPKVPSGVDVMLPELFSWNGVDSAQKYSVDFYPDSSTDVSIWSGYTDRELMMVPGFADSSLMDSTLYWSVTAWDSSGNPAIPSEKIPFTLKSSTYVPGIPVLFEPQSSDTVTQTPVTLTWSWPSGATRFTLRFSVDAGFPPDPDRTWTVEDITDSTISIDLSPADENVYWYVSASNGAGESSPSLTDNFTFTVIDTTLLSSVVITTPAEGMTYPFGNEISGVARIKGNYNGTVSGVWKVDGDSIASFDSELIDTAGVEVHSPSIGLSGDGPHTMEVVVVNPESLSTGELNFSISPDSVGEAAGLLLSVNPQSIPADGHSTALIDAFVVDEDGEIVRSDSARLVAFVILGEADFTDSSYAYTENGKVTISVTSTAVPDTQILVFGLNDSLQTGFVTMNTREDSVQSELSLLEAHMDRLQALYLEIYDPPNDIPVNSFDQSSVQAFLDERIIGVPEPAEEDKSAMRRLLYLERLLHHGYHYEYDQTFPDPQIGPGEGYLRMADNLAMITWESSVLTAEAFRTSTHLIVRTKRDSLYKIPLSEKVQYGTLSFLGELYSSLIDQLGTHPDRSKFIGAFTRVLRLSFSAVDTVGDPREVQDYPPGMSLLTRDIVETIIEDAQTNLDTAAQWAYDHNFTGSDSLSQRLTDDLIDVIDSYTSTVHTDFSFYHALTEVELPLENLFNVRRYYDNDILSRNAYYTLKNSLESAYMPERWRDLRKSAGLSMSSLLNTGYGLLPLALDQSFTAQNVGIGSTGEEAAGILSRYRMELTGKPSAVEGTTIDVWQGMLDQLSSTSSTYEEKARELIEALSESDSLAVPDLFLELAASDDSLSEAVERAFSPVSAVYPFGDASIPGFGDTYSTLRDLQTEVRTHRLMFLMQTYDFMLLPDRILSADMAVDAGSKAIDSIRLYNLVLSDFVTSLFTSKAYPLVTVSEVFSPDSVSTSQFDTLEVRLENLGAGTAQGVYVKLYFTPGLTEFLTDSVYVGDLSSGSTTDVRFFIKAIRSGVPEVFRTGVVTVVPYSSNGLGHPGFSYLKITDPDDLAWDNGPLDVVPGDSVVTIRIVQPVGGEQIAGDSEYEIIWESRGTGIDHMVILLSIDGGASYPDTVTAWTENDSSFLWTVPQVNTMETKIQVVGISAGDIELAKNESSTNFIIDSSPPIVDVVFPDGGDTLFVGIEYDIKWATVDTFPPSGGDTLAFAGDTGRMRKTAAGNSKEPGMKTLLVTSPGKKGSVAEEITKKTGLITGSRNFTDSAGEKDHTRRVRGPEHIMPTGDPFTVSLFYSTDSGNNWRIIALDEPDDSSYI